MTNLTDEKKRILDEEQANIINSTDRYIYVSACPGSGKTYTVVKRIEKELQEIEKYQGIVACSFTKEASEELKKRINKKLNLDNCFIGTIDSWIKNIICTFANRALKECNKLNNQVIIKNNIFFPEDNIKINGNYITKSNQRYLTVNDVVKYYDIYPSCKNIGNKYYNEWLQKLQNNEYEISFPSYFFASYIVKMDVFKDWFNNKYTTIYIDEAQDLNWFQHYFFDELKRVTNVNIVMVGDANQSIYQFRGARPELFKNLVQKGYREYKIDVSVRCHPSISYYANKIYEDTLQKRFDTSSRVQLINTIDLDFLKTLNDTTFILTENNKTAQDLYEVYKKDYDIVYSKKLDLDNKEYSDYYINSEIVDELLKYYLNYDNELDKYKYPYEKIESILKTVNNKIKQRDFIVARDLTLVDFLKNSCELLGIGINDKTINEIERKIEDEKYKYNYYVVDKKNRIMTIHSSKGLECDNAVIILNNQFNKINDEFKNRLFVAITRARENVYIKTSDNIDVEKFLQNLLEDIQNR